MSRTIRFDEETVIQGAMRANQAQRMAMAVEAIMCRRRRRMSSPTRHQAEQAERDVLQRLIVLRREYEAMSDALLVVSAGAAA